MKQMKNKSRSPRRALAVASMFVATGVALAQLVSPASVVRADDAPSAPASVTKGLQYVTKTLSNGMKVIACNDPKSPVVAVQVWYHVGSKNEEPTRQGFAHMFEHMMFRGTDRLGPKSHFEFIRQSGGDCNAYTAFDNTTYIEKLPATQLELAMYLEAERMAFLKIDDDSFYTERSVVEEERRMGLNAPYGTILERVLPQIFKKHPYMWSPIGQIPHLRRASIDELNGFWQTYYVPNNATLVIVGAIDAEKALDMADKYFSWIPKGADASVPTVTIKEPEQTEARLITLSEPKGPIGIGAVIWRTTPNASPDAMPLEILGSVLGGGESSRLYQVLVKDKDIATLAAAGTFGLEQDGIFGAGALQKPFGGASREDLVKATLEEIEKIKKDGITQAELDKAKLGLLKSQVESAVTVEGKAKLLGEYSVLYNDLDRVNRRFDEIRKVSLDDVKRVANTYLVPQRMNTMMVEPAGFGEMLKNLAAGAKKEEETVAVTRPSTNRTVMRTGPKATAARPANYPTTAPVQPVTTDLPKPVTQTKVLANGLKVVVLTDHQIPLVNVTLGLKNGLVTEPADLKGVAELAAGVVTQGTEHYTSKALATELDKQAISLGASVGEDSGTIGGNCLAEKFTQMMGLLGEVALRPTFPQEDFKRVQQQAVTALTMSAQTPEYLAQKEFDKRVYGAHPYGHTSTVAEIRKLTPNDLRGWWGTFVRPETSVLYIAGDVDPVQAFALAEKEFGAWKVAAPMPKIELPPVAERGPTTIYLVDKPGQVQSQIRVGQTGITRKSDQWAASRVLNQVFGGGFNSRLNETIRVKRGLTYGAGGGFRSQKDAGVLFISTFSKTPTTSDTVAAIMEEVKRLQDDPVTDSEMSVSKNFILGSFAGDRETPQQIIGDMWLTEYSGLPETFMTDMVKGVAGTSESDVKRLANSVIDPTKMVIVVVGDASKVKAQLEKIAPVVVVSAATPQAATAPSAAPAK